MPAAGLERLEEAFAVLDAPAVRRRMLVVVNPHATTMSDRLRSLVVAALASRYDVTAVDTEAQGHAIELARTAVAQDYDVVVAYGLTTTSIRRRTAGASSTAEASSRRSKPAAGTRYRKPRRRK